MQKKNSSVGESLQHRSYYDEKALKNGLNYYLRPDKSRVYITDVSIVDDYFNVREQALARTYMYRILNQKGLSDSANHCQTSNWPLFQHELAWTMDQRLDLTAMVQASKHLLGEQDFTSFRNAGCQSKSTIRNMHNIQIYVNKQPILDESSVLRANKEHSSHYPSYLNLLVSQINLFSAL
jgi:tRNA pseudouridine38-40 synthase